MPDIKNYIININSFKVLILNKHLPASDSTKKIALNILILTQDFNETAAELNNLFACDYVVADGSIPLWKCAKLKKEFQQLHLRFYSVAQDGAFILKL